MSEELLFSILESLRGTHIYELGIVGLGEPLANNSLEKHISIISQYCDGFRRISLNSNAVLMDEEKARLILESPVTLVTFSLNATNRNSYRQLMGRDTFNLAIKNIKKFISLMRRHLRDNLKVSIQYLSSELNSDQEAKLLFDELESADIKIYKRYVFNKPSLERAEKKIVNVNQINTTQRYPCWSMYSRVYVDIEGNCYPCTIGNDSYRKCSALAIENVKNLPLIQIFNGEILNKARKTAEDNDVPFSECINCTLWALFPNNFIFQDGRWIFNEREKIRLKALNRED